MDIMNMELYRIVSLEGFLSLIYNKSERFVRPMDEWEDTYEGHMLHLLDDEAGEKQLLNRLYEVILHRHTIMINIFGQIPPEFISNSVRIYICHFWPYFLKDLRNIETRLSLNHT